MKIVGYSGAAAEVIGTAFGGVPEDVPDAYRHYSPIYHAEEVRAPYYVAHGYGDDLLPIGESQKWVEALLDAGVDVTWRPYIAESHGFILKLPFESPAWQDLFTWLHHNLG
jgi:dipeptidyl aminopeptidase/acylaminoacyl peptidase